MRQYLALFVLLGACSQRPDYQPPPPPILTVRGLPLAYEACVQGKAQQTASMYDVYLDCRSQLVYYLAQADLPQETKAERLPDLDRLAMNYAQIQVEARHGPDAVRRTLGAQAPISPPSGDKAQMKQWAACSVRTISEAHQAGMDGPAIIDLARTSCGHLWTGTPQGADRLYGRILSSVQKGVDPGYSVSPPVPMTGTEHRI